MIVQPDVASLYDAFDSDPAPVVEFLTWIVSRQGRTGTARVLDVGCGTGRMFAPLRSLGWDVVGLEPDASYRARAVEAAHATGVFVGGGTFNTIDDAGGFDLVIGINSAFAHVLTAQDRADALVRCRRALRSTGALVLDLPNMLRILFKYRKPTPRIAAVDGCEVRLSREHTIDYHAATFTTHEYYEMTDVAGGVARVQKDHVYAITTWPELEQHLAYASFRRWEVYDAFTARESGRADGSRHIVVAWARPPQLAFADDRP